MQIKMSPVRKLTLTAMFAAISTILMYFEFPLPFMPPFLKLDLSGAAVMIAAFMTGPASAVAVVLIKDCIHLLSTKTGGVGELADFIMLSSFAVIAAFVYARKKDKLHALLASAAATLGMAIVAIFANKFLLIPFYSNIMPVDAIIGACAAVNPSIDSLNAYYFLGVLPFNLIKGALLSIITALLYKRLSLILKKANNSY